MLKKILFGDYLKRLDNIIQWQEKDVLTRESVSAHSYKVTILTRVLLSDVFPREKYSDNAWQEISSKVILPCVDYAMFHDWDEAFLLRDISHETKYNEYNGDKLRKTLNDLAQHILNEEFSGNSVVCQTLSDNDKVVKSVCKFCDWLAMFYFLRRERKLGNTTLDKEFDTVLRGIRESGERCLNALRSVAIHYHCEVNLTDIEEISTIH